MISLVLGANLKIHQSEVPKKNQEASVFVSPSITRMYDAIYLNSSLTRMLKTAENINGGVTCEFSDSNTGLNQSHQ